MAVISYFTDTQVIRIMIELSKSSRVAYEALSETDKKTIIIRTVRGKSYVY
jgi:hypothetical protein